MKATELMINDWVIYTADDEGLINAKVEGVAFDKDYNVALLGTTVREGDLSPIPLTPEILEKNGWVFMEGQDYSTFPVPSKWTYQFVPFVLRVDGETYSIANTFTIKYVHELQHALRLCGLDELANNFKI